MSTTLHSALHDACLRHGRRDAFRFPERALTFSDIDENAGRLAAGLKQLGLRAGDRVMVMMPTCPELVLAHLAVQWLGAVRLPVNPGCSRDELAYLLIDAEPKAIIIGHEQLAAHAEVLENAAIPYVVVGEAPAGAIRFDALLTSANEPPPLHDGADTDPAMLFYTSGTTGRPKGALLSHHNVLRGVERLIAAWRWTCNDRFLLALPLFHVHGLGVGVHGSLLTGCTTIVKPRFNAAEALETLAAERCTLFMGVPAMYYDFVHLPEDHTCDLGAMRLFISGSAPLAETTFAAFAERFSHRIIERYGATETMLTISNPYDGERRPGCIGLPLPGVEVRVVDEAGNDVPDGTAGELFIRCDSLFLGYHNQPEATAKALRDGWFASGDIGLRHAGGYLQLLDRKKNLIISGGFNIYPAEIEQTLRRHPQVRDAAVVGMPDDRLGEVAAALVVPCHPEGGAPVSDQELLSFCAARLARYKQPRIVRFVSTLPRNAMGKINTDGVRQAIARSTGSEE